MSWQATSWALREAPARTSTARLVLIALADRCDDTGRSAWPTIQVLASETHTSESTVWRCLRALEDDGVISRGDQSLARRDERGRPVPVQWRATVWVLNMHISIEHAAHKPGRQAREERQSRMVRLGRRAASEGQHALRSGIETVIERIKSTATAGRTCANAQSGVRTGADAGVCTGEHSYRKTDTLTNSPTLDRVPTGAENRQTQAARKICEHLRDARIAARLSAPAVSSRDIRSIATLLNDSTSDKPAIESMNALVDFAVDHDFFARTVRNGRQFARHFDAILDDRKLNGRRTQRLAEQRRSESVTATSRHTHDQDCHHVRKIVETSTILHAAQPDSMLRHQLDPQIAEWLNDGLSPVEVVERGVAILQQRKGQEA